MALRLSSGFRNKIMAPAANGGASWGEILKDGVIKVFSSNQPASADLIEAGTYLFTLIREGGAETTSGALEVGKMYMIKTFVEGDDFTNVGAPENATGAVFKATGTTPTTWTNSSTIQADVGLQLSDVVATGKIGIPSDALWRAIVRTSGISGWFRFYDSDIVVGASEEAIRYDGRVATSGGELTMPVLSITAGSTQTADAIDLTMPA